MPEAVRALSYSVRLVAAVGRWRALAWLFGMAMMNLAGLGAALLGRAVVNAVTSHHRQQAVVLGVTTALLLAGLLLTVCGVLALQPKITELVSNRFDEELVRATMQLPAHLHATPAVQDRLEQLRQVRGSPVHLTFAALQFVFLTVNLVVTLALLGSFSPALLLLPLFGLPLVLARRQQVSALGGLQEEVAQDRRLSLGLFRLSTSAAQASEVRLFGMGPVLLDRWEATRTRADTRANQVTARSSLIVATAELLFAVGFIGALVFSVHEAVRGHSSLGDVVLLMSLAQALTQLLGGLAGIFGWFGVVLATVRRYLWLTDRVREHRATLIATRDLVPAPSVLHTGIRLSGVCHSYPEADAPALIDVDLLLPAGATVAVVGENGAGKSTLVALLLGLLSPSSGELSVDGVALRSIDPGSWSDASSIVLQDHAKLQFIAQESIGVGLISRIEDREHVQRAVGRAAAGPVVADLPDGLDSALGTSYGQGGRELSGGQWQRLAVARGLMRETPLLLVMDEPTAALDAQAESELFGSYAAAARRAASTTGGITVLVSHRFSTVRSADLIIVLNKGRVVEQGDHAALMALGGLYAELYLLQAHGYR
jgi:ATP-binding cassette subfamily B protein